VSDDVSCDDSVMIRSQRPLSRTKSAADTGYSTLRTYVNTPRLYLPTYLLTYLLHVATTLT